MLFNSIPFWAFLPVAFALHWLVRGTGWRNAILLTASYVFYGWWDVRFLALIGASTLVDYAAGLAMGRGRHKAWLVVSLAFNLGLLFTFKYLGFFVESWVQAWGAMGVEVRAPVWQVILPVGISFYTFQTLSYTIDVYRGRILPERNLLAFATFVAFFPQLVAGPIERASHLLPQFKHPRGLDVGAARSGLRLMLWGLVKKVLVADACAPWVDAIFRDAGHLPPGMLLLGALLFAFQIYGDFSGYSDLAIGTARLFGVKLNPNFSLPYFAQNIGEFWRRWHQSLTSWFRDYLYIPLGGSRVSRLRTQVNVAAVFLVSGLWHGANWTFIAWGALHASFYLLSRVFMSQQSRAVTGPIPRTPSEAFRAIFTFGLVVLAWIPFRADSLSSAWQYLVRLGSWRAWADAAPLGETALTLQATTRLPLTVPLMSVFALCALEAVWGAKPARIQHFLRIPLVVRWVVYAVVLGQIWFHLGAPNGFIYFQF